MTTEVKWKAAATVVTGATALAGWLTSPSPSHEPVLLRADAVSASRASALSAHTATIEEQSRRLAARLGPGTTFTQPHRDPFHFAVSRRAAPTRRVGDRDSLAAPTDVAAAEPPPFPYRLSGVASDVVDGQPVRTAVLSGGATGLVLAAVGDMVGTVYRVDRIDEGVVELTDARDGSVVRLTFVTP